MPPNEPPAPPPPVLADLPSSPRPVGWARPWATAAPAARKILRAGAWYPVVEPERPDGSLVLLMKHRPVRVPARLVEVRTDRPHRFTVVHQSGGWHPATGTTRDLGKTYAVCPASGHRVRVFGTPTHAECPGCGYRGEIGWLETG